jgi:signal transduction histidine kinase
VTEGSGSSHAGSVLVIDDVPDNLRLLSGILKGQGYKPRPVPNGRLGLRAARNDPPDLILLDVDMPGMNGFEVCRALKADEKTRDIPVIFVSALEGTADKVEGLSVGGVDYISKPYQAEEVLARVRTHLSLRALQQRLEAQNARLQEQAGALTRATRRKDEFLASMSHELRTPLNAILGISEVLCEGVYGPLNERQVTKVRAIEESGRHLLGLINDVLDVSKIEAGKMELEVGTVVVEEVCLDSLQFIRPLCLKKQLQLSSSLDTTVTTLQADERRLKQILVNLLSNACKFTPEGGAVRLEAVGDADTGVVHLSVWDTGIGIEQEDIARLGQPFVQLDSRLSRQHGGTGLGLSLVRRLSELHGGSLSIESKVGEGSRFTVSLPWQEAAVEGESSAAQASDVPTSAPVTAMAGGGPLILLAEDDQANVETLFGYLEAKGYRIIVARDGSEAVDLARERGPDLIVMDIQMPGTDGLEAIRRIRGDADPSTGRRTGLADRPIIALTALAMPGDEKRCLQAGADAYLSKPVRLRQLVQVIAEQLQASGAS